MTTLSGIILLCIVRTETTDHLDTGVWQFMLRFDLEVNWLEFICTEIKVNNKSILVSVCYWSHTNSGDVRRTFLANFPVAIDRCVSWYNNHASSELRLILFDISTVTNVTQLINELTRYSGNTTSLLDLIFVNNEKCVTESGGGKKHCWT